MSVQEFDIKAHLGPPSDPARVVKPREPANIDMRILIVDSRMRVWYEDKTDMKTDWDLVEFIRWARDNWPRDREGKRRTTPIMLVCRNPHKVLLKVHQAFKNDPEWNFRINVNTSERFHLDGKVREPKVRTMQDMRIGFFGFRTDKRKTKYFHPITPDAFIDDFRKYGEQDWPEYIRLYHWAGHVRKWIRENKLRFSPSRGGLSAQLLRDKRFYPKVRRKVPKLTNENARNALPGNFYIMNDQFVGIRLPGAVYLIDQENAHHYAAETVKIPDGNSLFARGRFALLSDEPYARINSIPFNNLIGEYGLFRIRAWIPKHLVAIGGALPPWATKPGLQNIFLFSNELELALTLGVEIRYISYAWTSRELDEGLAKYSAWAQCEVKNNPDHKIWLKPTLLSAYGILGARPRKIEMAYWKATKGEMHRYLLGPTPLDLYKNRTKKEVQPGIANVIHRGMIEAETRKLSIELARKLETENHTVIGIHADAILVKDEGQQLPLLSPPWRVKDRLNMFEAIDKVSFTSEQVDILPGRKRKKNGKR